jgi:hypothetical protein
VIYFISALSLDWFVVRYLDSDLTLVPNCVPPSYGDGTQVIQFSRNVAEFLHCDVSLPTPLENDNQAALNLASSPMIGKGLRHAELRAHYFKDCYTLTQTRYKQTYT